MFVVRNTFLEMVGDAPQVSPPVWRDRAGTDSFLREDVVSANKFGADEDDTGSDDTQDIDCAEDSDASASTHESDNVANEFEMPLRAEASRPSSFETEAAYEAQLAEQVAVQEKLVALLEQNLHLRQENRALRSNAQPQMCETLCAGGMSVGWMQIPVQVPVMLFSQNGDPCRANEAYRQHMLVQGQCARQQYPCAEADLQSSKTPSSESEKRTTVMLCQLPRNFTRALLLNLLDSKGFGGKYNFLYMPIDFVRQNCLVYAFINLSSPEVVPAFWEAFDGFTWPTNSAKACRVRWSTPHQGLDDHVGRYRNSPLMHPNVPDDVRPVLFQNGERVAFPPPTKTIRAPRLRASRQRCAFWNTKEINEFAGDDA